MGPMLASGNQGNLTAANICTLGPSNGASAGAPCSSICTHVRHDHLQPRKAGPQPHRLSLVGMVTQSLRQTDTPRNHIHREGHGEKVLID